MKGGDDDGGVLQTSDVVDLDLRSRNPVGRGHNRNSASGAMPREPFEQLVRVTDRCRKPDPLRFCWGQTADPLQYTEEMPASVIARERVDFIDDHRPERSEELPVFHLA